MGRRTKWVDPILGGRRVARDRSNQSIKDEDNTLTQSGKWIKWIEGTF